MAVTHIVPHAAGITWSLTHAARAAAELGTPREGEYAVPQLGQNIRTDDDEGDEDDAILTRRPTRRDGAPDSVRPLGFADPSVVRVESINAEVDALSVRREQVGKLDGNDDARYTRARK